jgi:hypothetical protein
VLRSSNTKPAHQIHAEANHIAEDELKEVIGHMQLTLNERKPETAFWHKLQTIVGVGASGKEIKGDTPIFNGDGVWKDAGEKTAWIEKTDTLEEMVNFCSTWNPMCKVVCSQLCFPC